MSDCLPTRHAHVTVHELGDEAIVYDANGHTVNALTATAGRVLQRCDGRTAVADLARELHLHPGEVSQIVGELAGLGLVAGEAGAGDGVSRRGLLQHGAMVGGGIVVASIAVPMAAAQASGDTTATPIASQGGGPNEYYASPGYGRAYGQTVTVTAGTVITGFSFEHSGDSGSPNTVTFNLWDPGATAFYGRQDLGAPVVSVTQPAPPAGTALSVTFPGHTVSAGGPVTFTVVADNGYVHVGYTFGPPGLTYISVDGKASVEYQTISAVFTLYGYLGGTTHHALRAQVAGAAPAPSVIAQQASTGEKPPPGARLPGQLRGARPGGKPGR